MQPPPRKGNYAKFLKTLHSEQITKLQAKNQHECDLLEDIRNYTLKRSAIEKSYSEALLKISSAFLNKKIPNIPDIKLDGGDEKWNMWNVWRTVLEENEKLARARLAAVEVFHQQVADDAKVLRSHKIQTARKCVEQLQVVQKELQTCVQDVDKTKKMYFEEEHSAHDVRDKAKDIEEKLKKKKGSFFQSITSLQKNSAKVSTKREQLEEKSTGARNEYLLSLASANAHQTRYFVVDLQNTMLTMENAVYEKVQEYLMLIGRTELLTCSATQTSFTRIRDQAQQLTREYNLQCVYLYYPVLKQHIQYDFEPCENDTVDKVTAEQPTAAQMLSKEARRWATRIIRENNNIREYVRKLQIYQQMRDSGQKTDPNDINGPDLEMKIEELRQGIRRSETSKMKAEARIECLRNGGVNVDECLQDADSLSVQDLPRSASSLSIRTDASGTGETGGSDGYYDSDADATSEVAGERADSYEDARDGSEDAEREVAAAAEVDAMVEQERQRLEQLTAGWDDPTQVDWGPDDSDQSAAPDANTDSLQTVVPAPALAAAAAGVPCKCVALYNYTAQNDDELSIVENEQLEVLGEGDGDGWLRARNYRGQEGFVPHNYLDVERDSLSTAAGSSYQLHSQISFSSVDYTVDEGVETEGPADEEQAEEQAEAAPAAEEPAFPPPAAPAPAAPAPEAAPAPAPAPAAAPVAAPFVATFADFAAHPAAPEQGVLGFCVALYDYEASCEDELAFLEGQVIRVRSKVPHEVDDGWWEGEVDGRSGIFPSLVVEECRENGEPLTPQGEDEPPGSAPPVFTPPEVPTFLLAPQQVIITQPTPEVEHAQPPARPDDNAAKGQGEDEGSFELSMTAGQRDQYDSQFQETPCITVEMSSSTVTDRVEVEGATDEEGVKTHNRPPVSLSHCPPAAKAPPPALGGDLSNLGVAQIVITAATPMREEPEEPFPPPDAHPEQAAGEAAAEAEDSAEEEAKTAAEADPAADDEGVPAPSSPAAEPDPDPDPDPDDDQPTDSAPFPNSSSTASEEDTYTGPSTADNSQSQPPGAPPPVPPPAPPPVAPAPPPPPPNSAAAPAATPPDGDAEADDAAPPGVLAAAGTRGSIPDELEPHQLAKLQNLKESNA